MLICKQFEIEPNIPEKHFKNVVIVVELHIFFALSQQFPFLTAEYSFSYDLNKLLSISDGNILSDAVEEVSGKEAIVRFGRNAYLILEALTEVNE